MAPIRSPTPNFRHPLHQASLAPSSGWMRLSLLHVCWGILLLSGCSSPHKKFSEKPEPPFVPEPYVRIANTDTNRIELQIAAREFASPRRGLPTIWLTGVSHIGDTNYYAALQKHLDAQSLVLYEGVGAAEAESAAQTNSDAALDHASSSSADQEDRGSLQSAMAASLGLVFQLNAIDYDRQNFRNSDLSISQLRALLKKATAQTENGGVASESFEDLLQMMQGNSWFDALLQLALRLLGASPKFQGLGRLALIDLIGEIQGDPSRLQGLPPDMKQVLEVLLQRRNEKVISDLKTQLPRLSSHSSVAVFFGTGHMPDLETKLRHELRYRPRQQVWFTAFRVDLAAAKISDTERQFVDHFVKWQLKEAGSLGHGTN